MTKKYITILSLAILFLLAGCYFAFEPAPMDEAKSRVETAAAQTVIVIRTSVATVRTSTPIGAPTITNTASARMQTLTPGAATTLTTTATTSGTPCNHATFVDDVTIPDGSMILPNSRFTKTWRLRNTGSCVWNNSYAIVYAGRGGQYSSQTSFPLVKDGEVRPGEETNVSVELTAPGEQNTYRSYWRLRAPDDTTFGITTANASGDIWADFRVDEQYSFAQHVCSAQWSNGKNDLPCKGNESSTAGYVIPLESNVSMEDNQPREGPGLVVMAEPVSGGYIVGKYPPVIVPPNSDFRSTVSCRPGTTGCYIRFRVAYSVDGGPEETLGEWMEGLEGGVNEAVRDLDHLTGRTVTFSLYMYVMGTPDQSKGVWFYPRITK